MQRYSLLSLARHALSHHGNWQRAWRSPPLRDRYDVIIIGAGGHGLATAHYLAQLARQFEVRPSRLAHGLPLGGELEYVDRGTLAHAFGSRQEAGV